MINYDVTVNNINEFKFLGNAFNILDISNFFALMSDETYNLINDITKNSLTEFATQYLSKSYTKRLSNLFRLLLKEYGILISGDGKRYVPNSTIKQHLAKLIESRYYDKWKKLWNVHNLEYNPIKPYDMEIVDTNNEKTNNKVDISRQNVNSSNSNSTDDVTSDVTENDVYGFNSVDSVPSDKSSNKSSSNSSDTSSSNSSGSTNSIQDKNVDSEREIKRVGNIGNTSQQELIREERDILNYQIFDIMFKDIDSILCVSIY